MSATVLRCEALPRTAIDALLGRYGVVPAALDPRLAIPGSYWGPPEAGLRGCRLYFRSDTPVHSLLHELAHFVCMTPDRRARLDTDAGGDDLEECAVCYLEVLLAERLPPFTRARCLADMDAWGYSFREGGAAAWFAGDGRLAREWLLLRGLIDEADSPTFRLQQHQVAGR